MGVIIVRARLALGKRDRELAEKHAEGLNDLGFTVVKVASRGVSFEGTTDLFERTFQSAVQASEDGAQFQDAPTIPKRIEQDVDSIYFPTRPIFFAGDLHSQEDPPTQGDLSVQEGLSVQSDLPWEDRSVHVEGSIPKQESIETVSSQAPTHSQEDGKNVTHSSKACSKNARR
jgi:hypothetical protein